MKNIEQIKDLQAKGEWPPKDPEKLDEILGRDKTKSKGKAKTKTAAE
jgi:hypothetical protein